MSLLKNEIISTLQQQPTLLRDFPWYPTAYLAQATEDNNLQKLAAFVNHPLRVHMLLSEEAMVSETEIPTIQSEEAPIATPSAAESNEVPAFESTEPATMEADEKPIVLPGIAVPKSSDESFLFQPFHTVDYFASQGIKADQSLAATTRFDTQLKSFSQWLKTMKRADYETGQFTADPAVEAQAKASLEVKEVVTQAMADVLAQQGRHAQAIDVYRKLTLLHPEKSAFFAAQIEKLKA